jgi:ubiquinone/menaquinone biosynthesis C-methylase UbiE
VMEDKNEGFWSRQAGSYDDCIEQIIGRESRQAVFRELEKLTGTGHVLELGCGPGYFTRALAKNAADVLATDLSGPMLDRARNNLRSLSNVRFQQANSEHTPFGADTFDTVLMANVVLILEHPEKAIGEAFRVLRPGGTLLLTYFTSEGMWVFDRFMMMVRFISRLGMPPFRRLYSMNEICAIVGGAGFRTDEVRLVGGKVKSVFLRAVKP